MTHVVAASREAQPHQVKPRDEAKGLGTTHSKGMRYPRDQAAIWPPKAPQVKPVSTARHIGVVHARMQATVTAGTSTHLLPGITL